MGMVIFNIGIVIPFMGMIIPDLGIIIPFMAFAMRAANRSTTPVGRLRCSAT